MAYLCKDKKTREVIREYIDQYIGEQRRSPSIRDIAAGTGISRAMVQRYMAAMREDGEIDYGRRDIETAFSKRLDQNGAIVEVYGADGEEAYVSVPRTWVGEGEFFMITVSDDSMSGVGITEGDEVIIRRGGEFADGDIVAAEVRGEIVIRRATRRASGVMLAAENARYSDRMYDEDDVIGVAVRAIKNLTTFSRAGKKEDSDRDMQVFLL